MEKTIDTANITIRTDLRPGDIGYILYLHGVLYDQERNLDRNFEKYVAIGLVEFLGQYDEKKDRLWIVEDEGQMIGSIVIMGRSGKVAQLRFFLLRPEYRGLGLGKKLMRLALDFCKSAGYHSVYLWTTNEQQAAAHLCRHFGFKKSGEHPSSLWGKEVREDCYDLSFHD